MRIYRINLVIFIVAFLASCNAMNTGIFNQIIIEREVLNGEIDDTCSPSYVVEDANYFYIVLNGVFRAPKELTYKENYIGEGGDQDPLTPFFDPLPKFDNKIILGWTSLNEFEDANFTANINQISCRAIVNFGGVIYASFSNDLVGFSTITDYSNYNKIMKLVGGIWVDSNIEPPSITSPDKDANTINPLTDRLFPYNDNFEDYSSNDINAMSIEERNLYEMAKYFDMNQIRLAEAVKLLNINGELYALYNDCYIKMRDKSQTITYKMNPIYRLFKVDFTSPTSPILIEVKYDSGRSDLVTSDYVDSDGNPVSITKIFYKSEFELLELIQTKMSSDGVTFEKARYDIVLENLFTLCEGDDREDFVKYIDGDNSEKYKTYRRLYLQNSLSSFFKRYIYDVDADTHIIFTKDALFNLNITTTPPEISDISIILPTYGDYQKFRFLDFYIYDNNGSQKIVFGAASKYDSENEDDENFGDKKYFVWTASGPTTGGIIWTSRRVEDDIRNLDENNLAATRFCHYKSDFYPTRSIDKLLMGTTNGILSSDSAGSAFSAPNVHEMSAIGIEFEENVLGISISSTYITELFSGNATLNGVDVPIIIALTAGNGAWINYNRFWNRE